MIELLYWIFALIGSVSVYFAARYFALKHRLKKEAEAEQARKEEIWRREPYAFTKIPLKVHAARLMDIDEEDGIALASRTYGDKDWPDWFLTAFNKGDIQVGKKDNDPVLYVKTLEGEHVIRVGMWIIRGIEGEIYGCQHSIFEATYE